MIRRHLRLTSALALMLATATPLVAQQPRSTLAISGQWEVVVRAADGTVMERRSFENDLVGSGELIMTMVLMRFSGFRPGRWGVALESEGDAAPPFRGADGAPVAQYIVREAFDSALVPLPGSLQMTAAADNAIQLSGRAVAASRGIINRVSSHLEICNTEPANKTLADCLSGAPGVNRGGGRFTSTAIAPLQLEAGQVLEFSVRIGVTTAPHAQPPSH